MSERVFGITASTPTDAEQLIAVETTLEHADRRVTEGIGALLERLLPELSPGASLSVLIRRGEEAVNPTSHGSVAISDKDFRKSWDFTVGPYLIRPEEVPL